MEHAIFAIQQERIQQHKNFESAFSFSQSDFAAYRKELGKDFYLLKITLFFC